jgi:hypothetical protein
LSEVFLRPVFFCLAAPGSGPIARFQVEFAPERTVSPSSHFWGGAPCDDDPCGMNCLLCRSIFPLGVMAAFCSGVSLSVSTKPTAVKLFTQASTCRLASVGPTPRSSAEHSTISPVAGWIKRTFGVAVAHALKNKARMRIKRGMFSHSLSHVWKGKRSRPAVGESAGPFGRYPRPRRSHSNGVVFGRVKQGKFGLTGCLDRAIRRGTILGEHGQKIGSCTQKIGFTSPLQKIKQHERTNLHEPQPNESLCP